MSIYILCEGLKDEKLLNFVLPKQLLSDFDVKIVVAGGSSGVKSLARSLVVRRQAPVAIVVDAGSVIPEFIQERCENIEEIVKGVAGNTPVKVFLAVPEIEVVFFQDVSFLTKLLGYIPDQHALDLAVFAPKKILQQLLSQSGKINNYSEIFNQLSPEDTEILRKAPLIQEIICFLESIRKTATAATAK